MDKIQTHRLTADTLAAARAYLAAGDITGRCSAQGPVLRASRKGGALQDAGMTARALTARVHDLGAAVGLVGLSAHDLRTTRLRGGAKRDSAGPAAGRRWVGLAGDALAVRGNGKIAEQGVLLGERG